EIQAGPDAPTTPLGGTNFGTIGNLVASGPQAFSSVSGLAVGAIKGTFTYNNQTFLNVGGLLHALQTDGNVNVLSTPNILTMDNQKAEIMVGQNIPFVTGQSQTAATGGQLFSQIDRKDVGISLKITPQITSDDNVRLEVYQEISDVINTPGLNANVVGPSTSKRSASTTVVVKDRQTMVIGGLIRDNLTTTTSKVPLLGDIPIIGWLFKSKTTNVDKANLMIFITPYIIKNEIEGAEITKRKGDAIEKFRDENRIEKKEVGELIETRKPASPTSGVEQQPVPPAPAITAPEAPQPMEMPNSAPSPTTGVEQQPVSPGGVR
ncbi:MAG: hypothetical protein WAL29_16150, partial [Bacteroidales bacterium]